MGYTGGMTDQNEAESKMEADLKRATNAITWTHRVLGIIGLWPCEINHWLSITAIVYTTAHCSMCFLELLALLSVGNSECIHAMIELVVFSTTLLKLAVYKLQSATLKALINEIRDDFSRESYRSAEDLTRFLRYNAISKMYIKFTIPSAILSTMLYYIKPIIAGSASRQSTLGKNSSGGGLPFHVYYPFEVTESRTYLALYLYQAPMTIIVTAGYVGTDCLFVTLTLHVCGQFAALSYQIYQELDDASTLPRCFKQLILKHQRLIRLSKTVDSSFCVLVLYQVLLLTFLLCFLWHSMISSSNEGEYMEAASYFLPQNSMIVSLFGYCFIGECFIYESSQVTEALYFSRWYEMRVRLAKDIHMCLLRSQHPIELTAGKFFALSFSRFTEILKLSVAYLSFLRNFTY